MKNKKDTYITVLISLLQYAEPLFAFVVQFYVYTLHMHHYHKGYLFYPQHPKYFSNGQIIIILYLTITERCMPLIQRHFIPF